jgi:DNA polymerase-3 subunit epsilon
MTTATSAIKIRPIFFDTETTGLIKLDDKKKLVKPLKDQPAMVEFSAYDPIRNETFDVMINPGRKIPIEAQNIHHISDADVLGKKTFKQIWPQLKAWITDGLDANERVVLIAHNNFHFDAKMIKVELLRAGEQGLPKNWRCFDTLWLSRSLLGVKGRPRGFHKLINLAKMYEARSEEQTHRAGDDVDMLYKVFLKMVGKAPLPEIYKGMLNYHNITHVRNLINAYNKGTKPPLNVIPQASAAASSASSSSSSSLSSTPMVITSQAPIRSTEQTSTLSAISTSPKCGNMLNQMLKTNRLFSEYALELQKTMQLLSGSVPTVPTGTEALLLSSGPALKRAPMDIEKRSTPQDAIPITITAAIATPAFSSSSSSSSSASSTTSTAKKAPAKKAAKKRAHPTTTIEKPKSKKAKIKKAAPAMSDSELSDSEIETDNGSDSDWTPPKASSHTKK